MLKSKAIEIIRTFSPEELNDFSLFTKSPYFNSNKNIVKLFSTIKLSFDKIESDEITEEFLYVKVFPGKKYNYGIMKNLMSELYKLLEKFLTVDSSKMNDDYRFEGLMSLVRVYDDRFLDSHFKKLVSTLKDDLDNELIGFDRYHRYSLIEENIYYFNANRSNDKGLQDAVYYEMLYTICEFYRKTSRNLWKIDINIGNINSQYEKDFIKLLGKNINFEAITEGLKGISKPDYENLVMNNLLIKLVTEPENSDAFYEIKKHLSKSLDNYTNYERYSIISKVLSYCATAFRLGKREFVKESIDIKKLMMKKIRFNEDGLGPLNYIGYIETVRAFLHLNDAKGAENFAKNYSHWLEEEKRDMAFNIAMAFIEEDKGDYDSAIDRLANIKPPDQDIKLIIRIIYLRTYYSMGHYESGLSLISSFRNFIKEAVHLNDDYKKNQLMTLKIFEKLYKIKCTPEKYSAFDVDDIIKTVEKEFVLGAPWILQKAGELKALVK